MKHITLPWKLTMVISIGVLVFVGIPNLIKDLKKPRQATVQTKTETAVTVVIPTLKTTTAEFLGKGVVIGANRHDPQLRAAGFEKVRIRIEAGAIMQRDWEIVSPIAQSYQAGDVVQLWLLDHKNHKNSSDNVFFFLCRQPPITK